MDRKVNEKFYVGGVQYKCIEQDWDNLYCRGCDCDDPQGCKIDFMDENEIFGECSSDARKDGKDVIFVKWED